MRVAVIGARGRTGQALLAAAAARGWSTVAVARSGAEVDWDGSDPDALAERIGGCDAVVCAIGHTRNTPVSGVSTCTAGLVQAMKTAGCPRLVVITGAMIGGEHLGLFYRTLNVFVGRTAQMRDRVEQERIVRGSGLDWTIIRPPALTDGPAAPVQRSNLIGPMAKVSRASLAQTALDAISDAASVGDAFEISQT